MSPQRALAKKAPPVEVEDLDEVQLPQIARPMPTVAQTQRSAADRCMMTPAG